MVALIFLNCLYFALPPINLYIFLRINNSEITWSDDGEYKVNISGKMILHGVTNQVELQGKFVVKDSTLKGTSEFEIKLSDYDIGIPNVVKDKISEVIDVSVDIDFNPYKK